jgi:predicted Holliday junction resolvase-like endonuclease
VLELNELLGFVQAILIAVLTALWRAIVRVDKKIDEQEKFLLSEINKSNSKINDRMQHLVSREELKMLVETIHNDLREIKSLLADVIRRS